MSKKIYEIYDRLIFNYLQTKNYAFFVRFKIKMFHEKCGTLKTVEHSGVWNIKNKNKNSLGSGCGGFAYTFTPPRGPDTGFSFGPGSPRRATGLQYSNILTLFDLLAGFFI